METLVEALLATRLIVQFVGQAVGVVLWRRSRKQRKEGAFNMPLYPLPCVVVTLGFGAIFVTTSNWLVDGVRTKNHPYNLLLTEITPNHHAG